MEFNAITDARRSVKLFDPEHNITDHELNALFARVILTPSSFNLQNWRFVVVRDREMKAKLCEASWKQEQVGSASAVVVVAGKLDAHRDAPRIYADAPQKVQDMLLPMIEGFYEGKATAQRDEAVRSGSLAAMTLMYAAQDMGYGSCPMIGFDPKRVWELVGLDDNHVPVMMVVIGKQVGDIRPRPSRLPISEVVRLETMESAGLT